MYVWCARDLLCRSIACNSTTSQSHNPDIATKPVNGFQYPGGLVSRAAVFLNGPFNATTSQLHIR